MEYELLLPAKDYNIALSALYYGADAVYVGLKKYGARSYATNLSLEELKNLTIIAKLLKKKVYVTFNTIIKEHELEDAKRMVDEIAKTDVTGLITTDFAIINYIINNYPNLECHISTQVGLRNPHDFLFFDQLGAKRAVMARELSLDDVKRIKELTDIELEAFIHGALCVSYSGSCYLSSLLSLRSGNRGKCSQNCRREYTLIEDDKVIDKNKFMLSMRDLNVGNKVKDIVNSGIYSLKIEGRMKDKSYVLALINYYKGLFNGRKESIDSVFHRNFTKGFILGEDRGEIIDINNTSNVGQYIGNVVKCENNSLYISAKQSLQIGDRIRLKGNTTQYLTIDNLEYKNNQYVIKIDFDYRGAKEVYKVIDIEYKNVDASSDILPLHIEFHAKLDEKILMKVSFNNKKYFIYSDDVVTSSLTKPVDYEYVYEQLNKLNDTPFYIKNFDYNGDDDIYIAKSTLNKLRRDLVDKIYESYHQEHEYKPNKCEYKFNDREIEDRIYATCVTEEQYEALQELGIKTYYNNFEDYFKDNTKTDDKDVLISSFGGLLVHKDKKITTDYSFNVLNSENIENLLACGVSNISLSYETSLNDLKDIASAFKDKRGYLPPVDYNVYGYYRLMKIKACPLKKYGKCGTCQNHLYKLKDGISEFCLLKNGCNHELLNGLPVDLIDRIDEILAYSRRVRLDFTIESKEEVRKVIERIKNRVKANNKTNGYYKREIL